MYYHNRLVHYHLAEILKIFPIIQKRFEKANGHGESVSPSGKEYYISYQGNLVLMQKEEMQGENRIIVWPIYLDLHRTRKEGRLTKKAHSVSSPRISEIKRAAEKLELSPEIVTDKAHPAMPMEKTGYLTIKNVGPKSAVLDKIGAEIIRMRGNKQ